MAETAFRAVRSRRKFNKSKEIMGAVAASTDAEVKPHFIKRFDEIVADWEHKPEFKARKFIKADSIKINVFPAGPNKQIYKYVTGGTEKHPITPKNKPYLAFMWGGKGSYRPKTSPGSGISGPSFRGLGAVVGGTLVKMKGVQHPGTKARNFEAWIAKSEKDWYSRTMENIWRRAIRAA